MAGIGFELRRAVHSASFSEAAQGYFYAAIISAGPWIISVVTLAALDVMADAFLHQEARTLFAGVVTHTFATSLITTGVYQMFVTRYLADRLYLARTETLAPTFVAVFALTSGGQFVLMHLLLGHTWLPLEYRLPVVSLYVALCGIWLAMVFLSAARDYLAIVVAYAVGYLVSFVAAVTLGGHFGPSAYITGFASGQVLTLALLIGRVIAEFEHQESFSTAVFAYIRRYPSLIVIGLLYNLGFWIDKIVFWFSPEAMEVGSYLNLFPLYDTLFFTASLTVVPALAIFIVDVETEFYSWYKRFFRGIEQKRNYAELETAKRGMGASLRASYATLLKLQLAIVLIMTTFLTPVILTRLQIAESDWYVFRILVLAIGVQLFLTVTVLILLYLDLRGSVMVISGVFLATNLLFTAATIVLPGRLYGCGFLASSLVSLAVALVLLRNRFRQLEYLTFTRQPLVSTPEDEPAVAGAR